MNASYNVLEKPWIPVVTTSGSIEMHGLRQVILQAQDYKEISCASPLEEYSLYRFVALFLMDALRPESELDIEDLLENGSFSSKQIDDYISTCKKEGVSFDLFDTERPFLQCKFDPEFDKEIKPVRVLDCTAPSGNNHTHFTHASQFVNVLKADQAMRKLLEAYLFCTAAAQGYPSGVNGAPPFFSVIKGRNLFESLVYCLIPLDTIGISFDKPPVLWRRKEPVVPKTEVGNTSWLQGMLFPTRRIHLIPDESGRVIGTYYCQGENYVNKENWRDPYVTYRKNDKSIFPLRPHADRAIWRNLCDIVNVAGGQAPMILGQYQSIKAGEYIDISLYGVETSNASYLGVYRHNLSFPIALVEKNDSVELLRSCIDASESIAYNLKTALSGKGESTFPKLAIDQAMRQYLKCCEDHFWFVCGKAKEEIPYKELYAEYCNLITKDAARVYSTFLERQNLRSKDLIAAEGRSALLFTSIRKLRKEAGL